MAAENPFTQEEEDPKKKLGVQDPLFYEGKTPVLGEDVQIREPAGELTAMPEAGGPAPPTAPSGAAPTGPNWPAFPEFNLEMPIFEFNPTGTPPTAPTGEMPMAPDVPWWQKALAGLGPAESAYGTYSKLKELGGGPLPAGGEVPTTTLAPDVAEEASQLGIGTGGLTPELPGAATESLGGPAVSSPEALAPQGATAGTNYGAAILPGVQTALGAYNLYNADTAGEQTMAGLQTAGGLASTAAALAPAALGALAPLGPVAGAMMLPYLSGKLWETYGPGSRDKIQTPPGWQYVGGTGDSRGIGGYVVDPATGRYAQYTGKGQYKPIGIMTPDQATQYGIETTGELAKRPEFAAVNTALRNKDIAQAGQFLPGTTTPQTPTEAHQRSYLEEWRQPYIDQLKAQYPMANEGELWRLYTQSPWYQQELGLIAMWGPTGQPGGGGEGTGESNAPGGGPSLGGGLMG